MLNSKVKIKKYFSSLKSPYASQTNFIWRFLRNKEKRLFRELVKDLNKQNCLDLGSGSCEYSKILLSMGAESSVCVDFNPSLMSEIKDDRIEKIPCDVESFETDQKYDLILCCGILEFLDHPENFVICLKNFLKPKGKLIVLLPLSKTASYIYASIYLLKGIVIHPLTLKKMNFYFNLQGFLRDKTVKTGLFSGFAIYSISQGIKDTPYAPSAKKM